MTKIPMRIFSLNSREFYEAVCRPRDRAWIPNGALPRDPRPEEQEVIVERSTEGKTNNGAADTLA
ncbi:hypothetical protein [Sphingomonas sp.]|uniref:hypothetical protein n=1 Tax=Sphingomonas sp. TaxID=28214 RepID=UPI00286A985C|nr:hypothetical protein [Sphingomonas sp.]